MMKKVQIKNRKLPLSFLAGIVCLGWIFSPNTVKAGHDEVKKNDPYYVKVVEEIPVNGVYKCDTYPVTVTLPWGAAEEMQVAHPIISAVAFCPDQEGDFHSVTKIESSSGDSSPPLQPELIYWYAHAYCENDFGDVMPPDKVVLFCWHEEVESGFPATTE